MIDWMDGGDDIFNQARNLQDPINLDDSPPISPPPKM